ncbi:MAG TPA: flavin reductase family protein [Kiritimatiellae bacterium]|nr:flavin reductase family protein [Kiritimatiellia bacterium]
MRRCSPEEAFQLKYPEPIALAVSYDEQNRRPNIITLGWFMRTSFSPPMCAISVGHTRHSHTTIGRSGEFVLVLPSPHQADAVLHCGTVSGRDHDKFAETGLKALPATAVRPPLIEGAVLALECRTVGRCESGDHTIFIGEVLAGHIAEKPQAPLFSLQDGSIQPLPPVTV